MAGIRRTRPHFNPRPHAGGDASVAATALSCMHFNPRPHAGGDADEYNSEEGHGISIHAPTRGATVRGNRANGYPRYFNPRPHAGGDVRGNRANGYPRHFNPRPHAGGDH